MADVRTYSGGKFWLTLDGNACGSLLSLEGGEAFADVSEAALVTGVVDKRIGALRYQSISFEVSVPPEKPLYDWLAAFLNRSQKPMSGAVSILDYAMTERSRIEWDGALITAVTFPALDGGSKDPGRLTCVIQPVRTRRVVGSGNKSNPTVTQRKQAWLPGNFKLTMPGLETSAQHVQRIEPLVIQQSVTVVDGSLQAGTLQIPPLVLTVSASSAEPLFAWFDDFVVRGRNGEKDERSGSLQLLSPDMRNVMLELSLTNLGIFRVGDFRLVSDSESIQKVRAELYCEQMELTPTSAPAPPPPAVAPAPAPLTPTLASLTETVAGIFRQALVEAAQKPGNAVATAPAQVYRADVVAQRLLATAVAAAAGGGPVEEQDPRRALGVTLGTEWAATIATLVELERLTKLAATGWSAIVLRENDTLIRFLAKRGELAEDETGPIDLIRDAFTEGLVAGAADIRSKAAEHLHGAHPDKAGLT